MIKAKITGLGHCLPNDPVDNHYYASYLDTSDEWIQKRSGIKQRYLVKGQSLTDLASHALKEALENANLNADEIDLILVATTTADNVFPSCAVELHGIFNMKEETQAFDLAAACNGFVYGMHLASLYIAQGLVRNVAIIGAEVMSKVVDKNDRSTAVLFGDGAGAVILSATQENVGFLSYHFGTRGADAGLLYAKPYVTMDGQKVFVHAVNCMANSLEVSIQKANLSMQEIDLLIPHQANLRILNAVADKLAMPREKVIQTIIQHGNTSAASIPLGLYWAYNNKKLQNAQYVALCGMGAGLNWGSIVLKMN